MKKFFTIETLNDNGSGMSYKTKEEFLNEISLMIDDCIKNGGTFFDVQVDSDASCFCKDEEDDEEINSSAQYYCKCCGETFYGEDFIEYEGYYECPNCDVIYDKAEKYIEKI